MARNKNPIHPPHIWRDRIAAARTHLILNNPFFGQLSLMLKVEPNSTIDTMATNGKHLYVNPESVAALQNSELVFALAHEVLHVSNNHHLRMQNRDHVLWNIACDHAINHILIDCKFNVPDWVCRNPKYKGMHAEQIYDDMIQNATQITIAQGKSASIGDVIQPKNEDGTRPTQSDLERMESQNNIQTMQAANAAQQAGKLPDAIKRNIQITTAPKHDWKRELRDFIDDATINDLSWTKPSRRHFAQDPDSILPGKIPTGLNHLVLIIDTSGSINNKLLDQFASEIQDIASLNRINQTSVIYADAKVHKTDTFYQGEYIILKPEGGGGTDFKDSFEHVHTLDIPPSIIVYFTDMMTNDFGQDPNVPTLWACYNTKSPFFKQYADRCDFGKQIYLD